MLGSGQSSARRADCRQPRDGTASVWRTSIGVGRSGVGVRVWTLPNGETLRLGKETDPTNGNRKAFSFQLSPATRSPRLAPLGDRVPSNIEMGKTYWVAFSTYIPDWGTTGGSDDNALFGTQLHAGDNNLGLSPSLTLVSYTGRTSWCSQATARARAEHEQHAVVQVAEYPMPFGRWADFVFKFRQGYTGGGCWQVWMDGTQIANYADRSASTSPA